MTKFTSSFRKSALLAAPLVLMAVSGCAPTPFRADVSRFQQLPPAQGQSFAIRPTNSANDGGIEFGQYASLVSAEMQKLGYVPSSTGNADLTVSLDYGVDGGKERIVNDPFYDPFWGYGSFGYSRPYLVRTRHGARYVHGFYDPFLFGGYGYGYRGGFGADSYTVYTGNIDLKIRRNADSQNVFEGKAEAKSRSNKLAYLVPNLVEAMFTGFPGNNGETVRISVAPEPKR